jgi:hypothetical protein
MRTPFQRVALYARVSTADQTAENQVLELRAYCAARRWTVVAEYVDAGISGSTTSRPQLDAMVRAARRRQVDIIVTWASRSSGPEPAAPGHAAGRHHGRRRWVRKPERIDRPLHQRGPAPTPSARRVRPIRARADSRARAGRDCPREEGGQAPRATTQYATAARRTETPDRARSRPRGERSSEYPQLAVRVPRLTLDQCIEIAEKLELPQWQVVRQAVEQYHRDVCGRRRRRPTRL